MSASEAAAVTTRSRLRSSSSNRALLHIHPEEELAKHDSRSKATLRIPSSSMDIPTINTRSHDHHHHHHHHHHHPQHDEFSREVREQDVSIATRSKSKSRVLSCGPSSDDLTLPGHPNSIDSIHSLDGAHSTETQSSSKTIPQDVDTHPDTVTLPVTHAPLQSASFVFTKDALLHIVCSLIVLSLVVLTVSLAGEPATHQIVRTFKGIGIFSGNRPSLATSQQVQELREHLLLTLQVSTERLEQRVEGLKAEMREEMKRRKEEAEEMREEMRKEANVEEGNGHEKRMKKIHVYGDASYQGERPDYALATGGGRVVGHSVAFKPASSTSWIDSLPSFFVRSSRIHPLAPIILQPSFNQPGQCLPLASSNVYVDVALRTPIFPDQVTLSHVSKSIAYDISSAPKEFQIYGLAPPLSTGKPASWVLMGEFTYDIDKPMAAQAFPLWDIAKKTLTSTIKLQVLSNYGSRSHTCIYRLQVHGIMPIES